MMRLQFLGAAETVTGSRYLVESEGVRILVDCGLFQGLKRLRERNWADFPVDPASIDAVLLTHAHLDHTGYLPRLCQTGFRGKIYCTPGTLDLLKILLPDSAHLQEEEARHANKKGYSKHRPALPLYTVKEAEQCLKHLSSRPFHQEFEVAPGCKARFTRAGHIVGSASVGLTVAGSTLTFTGDVGRPTDPIMKPADLLPKTDFLVVESTYGNRLHPREDVLQILERLIREVADRKSVLMIPAFAVGRSQHILCLLEQLRLEKRIPRVPTFLNSPMAISATEAFTNHPEDHKISADLSASMNASVQFVNTVEESKALNERSGPMVLIAGSGMATGGRILHHFRQFLPDPRNIVLFAGYQSPGTRGSSLVGGATELKLQGVYVPVGARIEQMGGLSAHADYAEMIEWLKASQIAPRKVFVTHGEPDAADAFRRRLGEAFGWDVSVPQDGESANLE